jgi:HK97 family phage major capsid protein
VSWVSEAGQISEGTPEFGQVALTAKKAGLIIPMTTELFEDSAPDMQNILAKQFAESLAEAEDTQAVAGDGTVFTGILNDSDVHSVSMGEGNTAFTNLSLMDMFTLIAALKRNVAKNGKFFMNQTVWAYVKNMTDTNGNLIFAPTEQTLLGYPVVIMDDMNAYSASAVDTVMMGFGDLRNIYLGDRRQISIALADQATVGTTNLYEKDMLALRVTERVAIAIGLSKALALLKTAAE